jgi:hypothetical protein
MNRLAWFHALNRAKTNSDLVSVRRLRNPFAFAELFPDLAFPAEVIEKALAAAGRKEVRVSGLGGK